MPSFYPGSIHQVKVRVRNSGAAPTAVQAGNNSNINIIPDVGVVDLSSLLLMPIAPGVTVAALRDFTISPLAVPGSQNVWTLSINYDGQALQAQGDAFMVEVPPIIYPVDDWHEMPYYVKERSLTIAAGATSVGTGTGAFWAFIQFPILPPFTRATLRLYLVGWAGAASQGWSNIVKVATSFSLGYDAGFFTHLWDPQDVMIDSGPPPQMREVDITPWVSPGKPAIVAIGPYLMPAALYYRSYGSIRGSQEYWAHIELG